MRLAGFRGRFWRFSISNSTTSSTVNSALLWARQGIVLVLTRWFIVCKLNFLQRRFYGTKFTFTNHLAPQFWQLRRSIWLSNTRKPVSTCSSVQHLRVAVWRLDRLQIVSRVILIKLILLTASFTGVLFLCFTSMGVHVIFHGVDGHLSKWRLCVVVTCRLSFLWWLLS